MPSMLFVVPWRSTCQPAGWSCAVCPQVKSFQPFEAGVWESGLQLQVLMRYYHMNLYICMLNVNLKRNCLIELSLNEYTGMWIHLRPLSKRNCHIFSKNILYSEGKKKWIFNAFGQQTYWKQGKWEIGVWNKYYYMYWVISSIKAMYLSWKQFNQGMHVVC